MLKCWCSDHPEERPSFQYLLSQLEGFKRRSEDPNSEFSGKCHMLAHLDIPVPYTEVLFGVVSMACVWFCT